MSQDDRTLRGVLLMLPVVVMMGQLSRRIDARGWQLLFWRAVACIVSTFTFVWALRHMAIADALAIAFIEPFFILIWARFMMAEAVGPRRMGACLVGFAGALLVIQPAFTQLGWVALLPVATAISFGSYMMITRAASRHVAPEAMQFHTAWIAALVCVPPLLWGGGASGDTLLAVAMPQGLAWIWMAGVGVAASVAHMFLTHAFRHAPSATLAPLHYLEIVSAATLGWLVFGDFPNGLTWTGIGIIVASGLYVIYRERVLAGQARQARHPAGSAAG